MSDTPKSYEEVIERIDALANDKKFEDTLTHIKVGLKLNLNQDQKHRLTFCYGFALSELGQYRKAIIWYDKALAIKEDDFYSMRERGTALSYLGQCKKAIIWYDKALVSNPKDSYSMKGHGVALFELGQWKEAIIWYDKALEIDQKDFESMRRRGSALLCLGQFEEAIIWFDKALASNPDDYLSMSQLGVVFHDLQREEEAIIWYTKALEIKPDCYLSRHQRGVAFSGLKKEEQARDDFNKAIELNPETALRLYKYMSETRAKEFFKKPYLRFSFFRSLNDLHELNVNFKDIELSEEGEKSISGEVKKHKEEFFKFLDNKKIGILSVTSTNNNLLSWSYYTDHTGFAVEINEAALTEIDKTILFLKRKFFKVYYEKNKPNVSPANTKPEVEAKTKKVFFTKSQDWKHEKEYRCICQNYDELNFGKAGHIELKPENIRSIIMGAKIDSKHEKRIRKYVKKHKAIQLKRIVMDETKYELLVVDVDLSPKKKNQ